MDIDFSLVVLPVGDEPRNEQMNYRTDYQLTGETR